MAIYLPTELAQRLANLWPFGSSVAGAMSALMKASLHAGGLHPFLLDAGYWRKRVAALERVPRGVLMHYRKDLGHPGVEALELNLRAHDGGQLRAMLGRSLFQPEDAELRLRLLEEGGAEEPDWALVASGVADFLLIQRTPRRLEDRVLDVLQLLRCATTVDGVDSSRICLAPTGKHAPQDELRIAQQLRDKGLA